MGAPNIAVGQVALDPYNKVLYYRKLTGEMVSTSLDWLLNGTDYTKVITGDEVTISNDLIVNGNLTVNGTTTTINAEEVKIEDNILILNSNATGTPTVNAGIEVERGSLVNVQIIWNETTDKWQFTNDGVTYYNIDSIIENSVTLGYHTVGNYVKNLVAGTGITITNNSGEGATPTITNSGVLSINGNTGVITGIVTTSDNGTVTSTMIANGTIVNADINASAAIDKTKISGTAITAADTGTVTSTMIADGTIVNADINNSAAIAHSKLANGLAGQILLGTTTTGVITATTVSGDVTIDGAGVTAISSGVIVNADINASAAISLSKLASGSSAQVIIANGSGVPTYTTVSGDIAISNTGVVTIQPNSVALGTDTTGNYVASLVAGTGIILANNTGESATPTISIGQSVGTTDTVTFNTVNANLVGNVTGTVSNLSNHSIDDLSDVAISGAANGDFLRYNGSNWINDPVNLSTDTVGDYVAKLAAGTGIAITNNTGEGATPNIALNANLDDLLDTIIVSAANGQFLQYNGTNWVNSALPTSEPGGHENKANSTISFNESTRVFTIAPVSTSHTIWSKGIKYVKSTSETVTIANTSGLHYIYYNTSAVLSEKTTFFDLENDVPVAYVYWNATDSKAYFFADERHGIVLDWQTHEYLHRTRGAAIASGFGSNNYTTSGTGSSNADAQIDIADGTFYDEDLAVSITHSASPVANTWQQRLQSGAYLPVFYKSGSVWKKDVATQFPLKQGTSRPQYNLNTGGNWSTVDITNNQFGISWILATNNLNEPVIVVLGQNTYTDKGSAEASFYQDMDLTGFPVYEFRALYKIIYECKDTYSNTPKAAFRSVIDQRTVSTTSGGFTNTPVSDHGSMTGLEDDDHLQYVHTTINRTISATPTFSSGLISNSVVNTKRLIVNGIEIESATPSDTNVLKYSAALNKYIPGVASTVAALDDLTDVIISGATPNQVLKYDGTNWVNAAVPSSLAGTTYLTTIGNGTTKTFTINHALSTRDLVVSLTEAVSPYAAINVTWEATTLNSITLYFDSAPANNSVRVSIYSAVSGTAISTDLDSLSDVAILTPTSGQFLKYNGSTWLNSAIAASDLSNGTTGSGSIVLASSPTLSGVPLAATAAVDTNTTQIATTAFVLGQAASANPSSLGSVAVGTSTRYARADHVHPTTGLGLTSGTLAQFAATTSSQLAGVISDETGSGSLVFGTSPAITTSLTTGSASFDLINTTATTVNFAGAATALSIGAASGTTTINNSLVVSGNLTVSGTTTTVNTATLSIADNLITLNSDFTTGAPTENAGIEVLRGSSSTVAIRWNESTDKWQFTNDGTNYSDLGSGGGGGGLTVSDTPPAGATTGSMWFESDTGKTFVYYDSYWVEISGGNLSSTYVSDTAPATPTIGNLWYESDTGAMYVYYDSQWIETGGSAAYNEIIGTIQAKGDLLAGSASQALTRLAVGSNGKRLAADSTQTSGLAWVDDAQNSVITTKGDLLVGATPNTVARLPVGTNGQILVSDSSQTYGVGWSEINTRNILYNGAMQVAQRRTTTASAYPTGVTTSDYYTVDRWQHGIETLGAWTSTVEAHTSPTDDIVIRQGFRKSLKMLCYTAKASPSAGDNVAIQQQIEGQDLQMIRKGTSSAQPLTISFWVKANVTGTYIAEMYDFDNTRQCSKAYTINSSGVWEYKTITFPADTVGLLDNDNASSLMLKFWLGAGSTFSSGTLNTSWASSTPANRAVGQTNLASATNNYWQITGVQLNVGSVASPFEHKSFARDLQECQRYYEKSYDYGTAVGTLTSTASLSVLYSSVSNAATGFRYLVRKRGTPAVRGYPYIAGTNNGVGYWTSAGDATNRAVTFGNIGDAGIRYIQLTGSTTSSWYEGHYEVDAELI